MFGFKPKPTATERDEDRDALKLEIKGLRKEKQSLETKLEKLELKAKMTEEDIQHMVKISNERKDLELQKEKVKLQGDQAAAIARVKDQYRDKTEKQLEKQITDMKEQYSEILLRLPNFSVKHKVTEDRS